MDAPGCLIVIAGLPGSGKTSEARKLEAERRSDLEAMYDFVQGQRPDEAELRAFDVVL